MAEEERPLIDRLRGMDAFRELPEDILAVLAEHMEERDLTPGELLLAQGDAGDGFYIMLDGRAKGWLADEGGHRRELAEFLPDEVVGEMALITGEPRTASVEITRPGRAAWLEKASFHDLAFRYPELGMVLTSIMAARLGANDVDGLGGKVVGDYRILRSIGRGGMAVVYEAEPVGGGDAVALKMMSYRLLYERGAMARFQREASIIRGLAHPHIVRIQDVFAAYRTQFLVMEYCDGGDLGKELRKGTPWSEARVRRLAGQVAAALRYMHGEGVVHRDLKPSNVLLTSDGHAKLTDFGLARAPYEPGETPLTEARAMLGTPLYMAPEQSVGEQATEATDIYALGCILYEMLTTELPAKGRSLAELFAAKRRLELPPAHLIGTGIGDDLHGVLRRALAADPAARDVSLEQVSAWAAPLTG